MTQDISLNTLRNLMADVLDIDAETIGDDSLFVEDLGMESLMALEIMVALEKRYRVKLKQEDFPKIKKLRDVQALLSEKLGQAVA
jgi:acyl carrier protein